jgi:alkylation response protein AidB-like acyl-CoA dehydrogenase
VNFDLGPDELALRDGIRELCTGRFPIEKVRKGFDRDGWTQLADAGVFTLRSPESEGGVGLGMTEAVIVFEELGRALVPGPLVATHLSGGRDAGVLERGLLEFPDLVDEVLVVGDGRAGFAPRPASEPVESLDPLTPLGRVASSVASDGGDERVYIEGATLTAALSSGIASKTVELAVAYAKERHQFDKPIGSFQAVKHMCADMLVRAEIARAAVDAAGVLLDDPDADAATAVHSAKLLCSEYSVQNAKTCVQVHGGMGFTWEVDVHLYLKRAAYLATCFGGVDAHAERVAASF